MLPQTRAEAVNYLMGCINYERQTPPHLRDQGFKLQTMRALAARLEDPQLAYPVIHLAGTKGKGSTAAMTASILQQAGYRVGLYTSPHLHRLEERLVVNGEAIDEARLVAVIQQVKAAADSLLEEIKTGEFLGNPPTFFELITMAAWLHFRQAQVDVAVVEVGLGGRLDSTNICQPQIGVLTSISKDHMEQLGGTLAAIAGEKAGIIKPGMKVVSGVLADEARQVIRQRCQSVAATLFESPSDFHASPASNRSSAGSSKTSQPRGSHPSQQAASFDYLATQPRLTSLLAGEPLGDLQLALPGAHQQQNAALAITTALLCREIGLPVTHESIRLGLATASLPGRIEVLAGSGRIVVDVAHNLAAVEALIATLRPTLAAASHAKVVLSISEDKEIAAMLPVFLEHFDTLLITAFQENPRAMPPARLAALAHQLSRPNTRGRLPQIEAVSHPAAAMDWLRAHASPEDFTCVTGSTFLVSEMRHGLQQWSLQGQPASPNVLASSW